MMKYRKICNLDFDIPSESFVSYTYLGNQINIQYNSKKNCSCPIIKINKDCYYSKKTNEIKYFNKTEKRIQNKKSIFQSMNKLKNIVMLNTSKHPENALFITLTYAENMKDQKRLYQDFRIFNQKLQRYIYKQKNCRAEYIAVTEPQERGAFHLHVIYIFPSKAPFIDNKIIEKLWEHGFTSTKRLKNSDNIALYLSAYLCNLKPQDENTFINDTQKKSVIKGARLHFYPKGMRLYRVSRGIKKPEVETMQRKKAEKILKENNYVLKYEATFKITEDDSYTNIINKKEYKKVKK